MSSGITHAGTHYHKSFMLGFVKHVRQPHECSILLCTVTENQVIIQNADSCLFEHTLFYLIPATASNAVVLSIPLLMPTA